MPVARAEVCRQVIPITKEWHLTRFENAVGKLRNGEGSVGPRSDLGYILYKPR